MKSSITFKEIDAENAESVILIASLHRRIFGKHVPVPVLEGHWWLAYDGSKAVGFCGLSLNCSTKGAGFLCRSAVVKSHRGRGIQKKMIRLRERKAEAIGLSQLVSYTIDNPASSNSLISCGYRIYSPKKKWADESAIYWRKVFE